MTEGQIGHIVVLYVVVGCTAAAFLTESDRKYDMVEAFALALVWPITVVVIAWRALRRQA